MTQFQLESEDGTYYLVCNENCSKNNTGGLSDRKAKPKQVIHHANKANPEQCLVQIYTMYLEHWLHTNETVFYLAPLKKPKKNMRYLNVVTNWSGKTVDWVCFVGEIWDMRPITPSVLPQQHGYFNQKLMSSSLWIAQATEVLVVFEPILEDQWWSKGRAVKHPEHSILPLMVDQHLKSSKKKQKSTSQTSVSVTSTSMSSIATSDTLPHTPISHLIYPFMCSSASY